MLEIRGLDVSYGTAPVLRDLHLQAAPGQITCLVGRNGAGKTTTLKAIMGLLRADAGTITLGDTVLSDLHAHDVPGRGVGYIPQGRRLFSELTVAQNLEIGLMVRGKPRATRERVLDLFPRLRERMGQQAQTLSGGEQQMLATARALCIEPDLLLLDEPTEGLQPSMIATIREVIVQMRTQGVAVLLVEQKLDAILALADRVVVIEGGRNLDEISGAELQAAPERLRRHLGV